MLSIATFLALSWLRPLCSVHMPLEVNVASMYIV